MRTENNIRVTKLSLANMFCQIWMALFLFSIGGLIYITFRSENLRMFAWAKELGISNYVWNIRESFGDIQINDFVKYSLPDGLWLLAYLLIVDTIWNDSERFKVFFISALPVIAISSEIMQMFGLMHGVFDFYDLCCYLGALLVYKLLKL